jgi:beta-phosphoglucomutase-like phosphatase (HAD superfamily)
LVVEDAAAGIAAAINADMLTMGVGSAFHDPQANIKACDLSSVSVKAVLEKLGLYANI